MFRPMAARCLLPACLLSTEPPISDLWTVKGEEHLLEKWQAEDTAFFAQIDPMVYFHPRQIEDFLRTITDGTRPLVDGDEGRKTVEDLYGDLQIKQGPPSGEFPPRARGWRGF